MWGDVTARAAAELRRPEVEDHFARLIQRTSPKSYAQVRALAIFTVRNRAGRSALETATGKQQGRRGGQCAGNTLVYAQPVHLPVNVVWAVPLSLAAL